MQSASVTIPVHRAGPRLEGCLRALRAQDVPGGIRVIVSLDGDVPLPEETASLADTVVSGAKSGPAAARNRGWRSASDGHVLFTDSDCIPAPDWAGRIISALERGADGVKGAYSSGGGRIIQRLQQVEFEERYSLFEPGGAVDMVDTYSCGFRRGALEACGGFDEGFTAADHEDVDLSYRMKSLGFRLVFEPDALVEHEHKRTLRGYLAMKFSRGRWRLAILQAHASGSLADRYIPLGLRVQLLLCAAFAPAMIASVLSPCAPLAWLVLFLAASWPLAAAALRTDPAVAPLVPAFAFARGTALACGLAWGVLRGRRR